MEDFTTGNFAAFVTFFSGDGALCCNFRIRWLAAGIGSFGEGEAGAETEGGRSAPLGCSGGVTTCCEISVSAVRSCAGVSIAKTFAPSTTTGCWVIAETGEEDSERRYDAPAMDNVVIPPMAIATPAAFFRNDHDREINVRSRECCEAVGNT